MTLSTQEPQLDDLWFQTIVDEARKRIITYCPEWTDYNLSDPGITLIELFAWMTDMLGYRFNRIPEKNYFKFLEMIGTVPRPPEQSKTELTFFLATPFPLGLTNGDPDYDTSTRVPVATEVATRRSTGNEQEIIFTTDYDLVITPPKIIHLRRDVENNFDQNYLIPRQKGDLILYDIDRRGFFAFHRNPQTNDAFYLGFEEKHDISGYFLRFNLKCNHAHGTGVNPDDPPLIWECYTKKGWEALTIEEDTTRGLNVDGEIKIHLPLGIEPTAVHGVNAIWIRCRMVIQEPTQGRYNSSPHIQQCKVYVLGGTVPGTHSSPIPGEILGESSGDPGQEFKLPQAPVLPLDAEREEYIQVEEEEPDGGVHFVSWQQVPDFSLSGPYDRHYLLNIGSGQITFGPSVRQPDGNARQYGSIPKLKRRIRVTRYRLGGGSEGNVPRRSLRVMKRSISYIVDVTNRKPAVGGKDTESIEAARLRAQATLRTQHRAVTREDYEYFCQQLTYIARVRCKEAGDQNFDVPPGTVMLLVVPGFAKDIDDDDPEQVLAKSKIEDKEKFEELRQLVMRQKGFSALARLKIDYTLQERLQQDLERYRVLGITLDVREPFYRGVKIEASIEYNPYREPRDVRDESIRVLREFITPLAEERPKNQPVGDIDFGEQNGNGVNQTQSLVWEWPFGRNLYMSDIYAKLQTVPGVEHVTGVRLSWCDITPDECAEIAEQLADAEETPDIKLPWQVAADGVIRVPDDGLLMLLDWIIV